MPKQKLPTGTSALISEFTDARFNSFATDPRFRLPSKKQTRTKIDKRFSRMLKDDEFSNSATVDRYGRKISSSKKKKALERLYLPEDEDEDEDKGKYDDIEQNESGDGKGFEIADDKKLEKELKLAEKYDPARGGGFSSSEDDDEEEEEEEEEDGGVKLEDDMESPDMQAAQGTIEMGDISSRFAVVNLDWDNIKSIDLYAVFSSFLPLGGKIHKVSIYPSEFGKERMDREQVEGPLREIFVNEEEEDISDKEDVSNEESEDDEKIAKSLQKPDDGKEYNDSALRQYQLERLRYYYAVVICSSPEAAQAIYEATDGSEYLSSANFFDLRFIPDGVDFEDSARDECTEVPAGYRPTEFITTALQHSRVKLTWDTDPAEASRKEAINRAFSGSRSELNENDLRAYLGSDSESEDDVTELAEEAPKVSRKEVARQKMRAALGLADEELVSKNKKGGPVGDMEVTFTAGLSTSKGSVFENEPIVEETTAERYIRLEKERKARRKERNKAKHEGQDPNAPIERTEVAEEEKQDLGFDDPFFAGEDNAGETKTKSKSKSQRKADRIAKRDSKAAQAVEIAAQKAQLELLMVDNTDVATQMDHFDINEIARFEKNRRKKGKGKRVDSKRGGLQESFDMDVQDPRFEKVFESHEFAIDPSHSRFKGTEGMKKLLEEGRRKRRMDASEEIFEKSKRTKQDGNGDLTGLVEKLKKSKK